MNSDDKDEKIISKFLKDQLSPREENFDNVMVHIIVKTIETRNKDMFYILWRAADKDIMAIFNYVKNMKPHIEIDVGRTKGIEKENKIFKIVYKNDGDFPNKGGYNTEPHLLLFRIDGKSTVRLENGTNDQAQTKLESLYSTSTDFCYLKKFVKNQEDNYPTVQMVVDGEDADDEGYYIFALFYKITSDSFTIRKFAHNYPFYQVVAQTRPVKLSEVWKDEMFANEHKIEMITGAVNSSISLDGEGNMTTKYETKIDSHLLLSPSHFQTTLAPSNLPILPSRDRNRESLKWIYEMNGALVGSVKQSLIFQYGCGVFDVCPFPLITYASLPSLPEQFFINSLEKTYSIFGHPTTEEEEEEDVEYNNEFFTVFFTSATSDLPYVNDRLYGRSSDDMRSIRGVNSGDCDDAAIMIYQTVLYFLSDGIEMKNRRLKKLQEQVKRKYLPGICVMSLVTDAGDAGLHQICVLYPIDLYNDMMSGSSSSCTITPILLEGTSKSFSSIYYHKGEEAKEMIKRYATALCSVFGPTQERSKFCAYQLDAPNMLPDNYHAHYNNLISFSSGDERDKSKFRCLRFTGSDRVLISEGVHYRKVLTNGDYWLVDADLPNVDPEIYKQEMIESAKCIFPVPKLDYDIEWEGGSEKKFNRQDLLDLIEGELHANGKIRINDGSGEKKGSEYNKFNLDRVVFTLRRCYFDNTIAEIKKELQNIATLCREKNYSYTL